MSHVLSDLTSLTKAITSPDNNTRQHAEDTLNRFKTSSPNEYITHIISLLSSTTDTASLQVSAVLLRQFFKEKALLSALDVNTKNSAKVEFIRLLTLNFPRVVYTKIISAFTMLMENQYDPSITKTLISLTQSSNPVHREGAFLIIDDFINYSFSSVYSELNSIKGLITTALASGDEAAVKISAVKACSSLMCALEEADLVHVIDCVPHMFQFLSSVMADTEIAQLCISHLSAIAGVHSTVFRTHVTDVLNAMFTVASTADNPLELRCQALDFLLTLGENAGGMLRKIPFFTDNILPLTLQFLLEYDETLDWNDADNDGDQDGFQYGLEALRKSSASLGAKLFLEKAFALVSVNLESRESLRQFCALTMISRIVEETCETLENSQVDQLLRVTVPFLQSSVPLVRFSAVRCLLSFAEYFAELLRKSYAADVLGPVVQILQQPVRASEVRIYTTALQFVIHISADADEDFLSPYIDTILQAIIPLLQTDYMELQEETVTTVASMASAAKSVFPHFYPLIVPGLKNVLSVESVEAAKLRGKTLECLGMIGDAVGSDMFLSDALEILEYMTPKLRYVNGNTSAPGGCFDDEEYSYIHHTFARISTIIGSNFLPYLDIVVTSLLHAASQSDGVSVSDRVMATAAPGVTAGQNPGEYHVNVQFRGENKLLTLNTCALAEKAVSCTMLFHYLSELKQFMTPYIDSITRIMIPLVRYQYNEEVRIAAVASLPLIMECAAAHEKQVVWDYIFPAFIECITLEIDLYVFSDILAAFMETLDHFTGEITVDQMNRINAVFKEIMEESRERRKQRLLKKMGPDYDEVDEEDYIRENDLENDVVGNLVESVVRLCKNGKASYVTSFHTYLFPIFSAMLQRECSPDERTSAVCVFDEIIANGGEAAQGYITPFIPFVLEYCLDADVDVRQSSFFGVGVLAEFGGKLFVPAVPALGLSSMADVLQLLKSVITKENARDDANGLATDNAISAFGKIVRFQSQYYEFDMRSLIGAYVSWLPVVHDELEAETCNTLLCDFVEGYWEFAVGEYYGNVGHLLYCFGYYMESEEAAERTCTRMLGIVRSLKSLMSQEMLAKSLGGLGVDERALAARLLM